MDGNLLPFQDVQRLSLLAGWREETLLTCSRVMVGREREKASAGWAQQGAGTGDTLDPQRDGVGAGKLNTGGQPMVGDVAMPPWFSGFGAP